MKSYRTLLYVSLSLLANGIVNGCSGGGIVIKGVTDQTPAPTPTPTPTPQIYDDKGCWIPPNNRVDGKVGENYTYTVIGEGPQAGTVFCIYKEGSTTPRG
jgi:hypothetical protein